MKEIKALGIDLSEKFSSVAYIGVESDAIVSMSVIADESKYLIPTALYKKKGFGEWLIGDQAMFASENEEGGRENIVRNVVTFFQNKEVKYIENTEYTGEIILKYYMRALYKMIRHIIHFDTAEEVIISVEKLDRRLVTALEEVFAEEGIRKVSVINHTEAFAYFVLNTDKQLWANDVEMFELNERHFLYKSMTVKRKNHRRTVFVECEDLSELVKYSMLSNEKSKEQADHIFSDYLFEDYRTHIVSSVYFTGMGFYDDWYKKSINEVCRKRRAFKGFNLYSDGAAAAALYDNSSSFLFCEGRTVVNIGVVVLREEKEEDYFLLMAGENWTKKSETVEMIVDAAEKLQLVLTSPFNPTRQVVDIELTDIPKRENKTVTISVDIVYEDESNFEVIIEEKGFGKLFPATGMVIRKRISL